MILDRTNVFVHAMPAVQDADTKLWRVTACWHEVTHWERIDVTDIREKARFIQAFGDKIGAPLQLLIWMDAAIDRETNNWLVQNRQTETLKKRIDLLLMRVNDQEKTIAAMDEELTQLKEKVRENSGLVADTSGRLKALEDKVVVMGDWIKKKLGGNNGK